MFNPSAAFRLRDVQCVLILAAILVLPITRAAADDHRDAVVHAGGAVEFSIDQGWTVSEVPVGREVRLYLTRGPLPKPLHALADGAWLVFHARARNQQLSDQRLAELMTARVREAATSTPTFEPPQKTKVGGHAGVRGRFHSTVGVHTTRGVHLLAPVDGGLFELHMVAADADFAQRLGQLERILQTLKLRPPKQLRAQRAEGDAASILGTWKALHSRLQIQDDGRVVIRFDRKGNYAIDQRGTPVFDSNLTMLAGRYRAQDDLLLVTWSDGSRTNYRWRRQGPNLFLTDHTGRTSQLRRIY